MRNEYMEELVNKYFKSEGYQFPGEFEHRLDPDSSACLYSMIREWKPTNCLSIGTWNGGSTCVIAAALKKNGLPFTYLASELLDDKREATHTNVLSHTGVDVTMLTDITLNKDAIKGKLDFLFIDDDHDLKTTIWIFENILPKVKRGGLVFIHDWAVEELPDGTWNGKGKDGVGGWEETNYIMDLHKQGKLPLKKIYWNFHNPGNWESSFWEYTG